MSDELPVFDRFLNAVSVIAMCILVALATVVVTAVLIDWIL